MLNLVIGSIHIVGTWLVMELNRKSLLYKVNIMSKKLLSSQTNILSNFPKKIQKKCHFRKSWTLPLAADTS